MCTVCGDSGYRPAVRYGLGYGTGGGAVIWADYAVKHWSQPMYIPLPKELAGGSNT